MFFQSRYILQIDPFFRKAAFGAKIPVYLYGGKDRQSDRDIIACPICA
jgi:hypothetical protein